MQLLLLTPAQLEQAIQFIERQQANLANATAYFGESAAEIAAALADFTPPYNALLAYEDDQLIGFLGVDSSEEVERAWFYGPMVEGSTWQSTADALYAEAKKSALIPAFVREQELFTDVVNNNIAAFASRHGFTAGTAEASFRLDSPAGLPPSKTVVIPLNADYEVQFTALHEALFPNAYFTAAEIIERIGSRDQVLIAAENGALAGYIYARVEPGATNGYIDFVGVAEQARRRGIGKTLIVAAAQWLFSLREVVEVTLTVNAANSGAIALYEALGFTQTQMLIPYRKRTILP